MWLHARLEAVHGENPTFDYMHKLRAIIRNTAEETVTPNIITTNSLNELKKELGLPSEEVDE